METLVQPPAAALAVCFAALRLLLLFIYFIVEAHIYALAGRISVTLMSFDLALLRFLFFIYTYDRSAS